MKQLTCEMCGSTELVKQNGFFVCQTCGTKYSVEEAKKMMIEGTVEVQGSVNVQNAAQLDSLLKLAYSSYNSKNYAQAEDFCNQVIAMDSMNYDAWKLKGEAINYQITSKNPRILEVYNCIMTSYRVLSDEKKDELRGEILSSLKTCFEGEIKFWLDQFEAGRPTDSALSKVKSSYIDSYNKMADAFDELDLNESKSGYLDNFDNYFIKLANQTCVSAWKSTVGYNYYRDDFKDFGAKWEFKNGPRGCVDPRGCEGFRPSKEILTTFISEADNLISLLEFAIEQFNDKTDGDRKINIYENICFFHERLIEARSYKIEIGFVNPSDAITDALSHSYSKKTGWMYDSSLTEKAKESRRETIAKYEELVEEVKEEEAQAEIQAKQDRIDAYWKNHIQEKSALDNEAKNLEAQKKQCTDEIARLQKQKDSVPALAQLIQVQKNIEKLEAEKKALGLFKRKEKETVQEKINVQEVDKNRLKQQVTSQQQEIEQKISPIRAKLNSAINRLKEIEKELTMDRDEE